MPSPDSRWTAVKITRICPGFLSTELETILTVQDTESWWPFSKKAFALKGEIDPEISWNAPGQLTIAIPDGWTPQLSLHEAKAARIRYVVVPRSAGAPLLPAVERTFRRWAEENAN
jgi:hypothetical protein